MSGFARGAAATAPLDPAALIKELEGIQAKQEAAKVGEFQQLARQFQDASKTDAVAEHLYVDAVRKVRFDPKAGDSARFPDWKKGKKDLFNNKAFQAALKFHLRYLAISLKAASNAKPDGLSLLPELQAYISDIATTNLQIQGPGLNSDDENAIRDLVEKPVAEGAIARAYFLNAYLEKLSSKWEPTAGDWKKILDTDVRDPMRAIKDPHLPATWQYQIDMEKGQFTSGRGDLETANFTQVELPKLMWSRAQDMVVVGQTDAAIAEMTRLVRGYPQHPDLPAWVQELTGLLKEKIAAPAPASPAGGA